MMSFKLLPVALVTAQLVLQASDALRLGSVSGFMTLPELTIRKPTEQQPTATERRELMEKLPELTIQKPTARREFMEKLQGQKIMEQGPKIMESQGPKIMESQEDRRIKQLQRSQPQDRPIDRSARISRGPISSFTIDLTQRSDLYSTKKVRTSSGSPAVMEITKRDRTKPQDLPQNDNSRKFCALGSSSRGAYVQPANLTKQSASDRLKTLLCAVEPRKDPKCLVGGDRERDPDEEPYRLLTENRQSTSASWRRN